MTFDTADWYEIMVAGISQGSQYWIERISDDWPARLKANQAIRIQMTGGDRATVTLYTFKRAWSRLGYETLADHEWDADHADWALQTALFGDVVAS